VVNHIERITMAKARVSGEKLDTGDVFLRIWFRVFFWMLEQAFGK